MANNTETVNLQLFKLLKSKGLNPVPLNSQGKKIPVPGEAEVFQFTVPNNSINEENDDKDNITVSVAIDDTNTLKVYYDDNETDKSSEWYSILRHLKNFGNRRQLDFDPVDEDELVYDMAKRTKQVNEGYHAINKKTSYNDAIPNVKIIVHHNRTMEEGMARFRNIEKIYLENVDGERILCPTKKPGIAKVYANILAEGDKPYGERWNHVNNLVEEYRKIAGFVNATKKGVFNEGAQKLVEAARNHYQSLRETLRKLTTHRGYNKYFENWSPVLNEINDESESFAEMFRSNSLDKRIEAALPVLSRIGSQILESEQNPIVDELKEWADSIENEYIGETKSPEESENDSELVSQFVEHYKDNPMGMFMNAKSSYLDAVGKAKNFSVYAAKLSRSHEGMSKNEFQDTVIKHFGPHLKKHGWPKHASPAWGEAEHDMLKRLMSFDDINESLKKKT